MNEIMSNFSDRKVFLPHEIRTKIGQAKDQNVYIMDAGHRGDMYHLRVARALENGILLLYRYKEDNSHHRQLRDYCGQKLENGEENNVITASNDVYSEHENTIFTWNGNTVDDTEIIEDSLPSAYDEGGTTRVIERQLQNETTLKLIKDSTVLVNRKRRRKYVYSELKKTNRFELAEVPENSGGVLVLSRDSGVEGGAHPELDSGASLVELIEMIKAKGLPAITCGSGTPVRKDCFDIGRYWTNSVFSTIAKNEGMKGVSRRDIEASFLEWAYEEKKYFSMVVGFRSGFLDLFTFLGIPTVSIGVRHMVGEDRHERLALAILKRVNVQYNVPRHPDTAWVKDKYKDKYGKDKYLLKSPFNVGRAEPRCATQRPPAQSPRQPPGQFTPLDTEVVSLAISYVLESLEEDRKAPSQMSDPRLKNIPPILADNQVLGTSKEVIHAIENGPILASNDYRALMKKAEQMQTKDSDIAKDYPELADAWKKSGQP